MSATVQYDEGPGDAERSARRRAAQRLSAQHAVARILAEAEGIADASPRILRAISESLGWDVGGLWIVDAATQRLRAIEGWVAPGIEAPEFLAMTAAMRPGPGEGLPGNAWKRRRPIWIENLAESGPIYLRAEVARRDGLHGAFAFPILLGAEVLGVMDFFSREVRTPDADVLEMLTTFGSQIGQFMERKRIEAALRASEAQLQAIIDNSPSYVYVTDLHGRVLLLNRGAERLFAVPLALARGQRLWNVLPPELSDALEARPSDLALTPGRVLEREAAVVLAGERRVFLTHRFLLDTRGAPHAVCAISTDITASKRAEDDLRALSAELAEAEDRERRRLARDLHDSLGQGLSALKLELSRALSDAPELAALPRMIEHVDTLIAQARTMIFDLYPSMLDDLGLVPTLHKYLETFRARTGLETSFSEIGERRVMTPAATNYLFRATKELLNNVAKHARAHEVLMTVHWRATAVRVAVADDGVGFDPELVTDPRLRRGLGLADLRERVRVMGGQLLLDSAPGHGSHVVIELPLGGDHA
ncbi:GAF domain-containing protein [Myxococcota bacterium]|nr:GAF domain-containing protein [Myxococcota bacterium]